MFSRNRSVSMAVIAATTCIAAVSLAADAPKMIALSGKSAVEGKVAFTAFGKDGWVGTFDESGTVSGGNGPDHKLHCFGTISAVGGVAETHGFCDESDADGDHILWRTTPDLRPEDEAPKHGMRQALLGTGKYAGVTGWSEYTCTRSGWAEYESACESHGMMTLP